MLRKHNELLVTPRLDFSIISILLVLACANLGIAQEKKADPRLTITSREDVDDDFRFTGEYQGHVKNEYEAKVPVGLQIYSKGSGKFGGMYYANGLPGTGWNGKDREKLDGVRSGALLELSGDTKRVEMVNGSPTIYDKDGKIIGELKKVFRTSATLGMAAPQNALTLFDGTDTRAFKDGKMTDDGLLEEGTELLSRYRDFTLHAEFCLPYMPNAKGQARSNSGFYLQSSYEVQVLDSFGLEGVENECGALYRYKRPDMNMCLPPLQWQTYDITFRSPRFDSEGNKIINARLTVLHNGVPVHNDFEVERKTGAGKPEEDVLRAIKFQDHSNPVRFRNIWIIDLERDSKTTLVASNAIETTQHNIGNWSYEPVAPVTGEVYDDFVPTEQMAPEVLPAPEPTLAPTRQSAMPSI